MTSASIPSLIIREVLPEGTAGTHCSLASLPASIRSRWAGSY